MRRVSIFGATGSIGQNTIDLIKRDPDGYDVVALTGASNVTQLAQDAIALNADVAVTAREDLLPDLKSALADWTMSAIVGAAGLAPGIEALKQGTTLALANKESLVTAGPLLKRTAHENGAKILPVDSEHSAIFQALVGEDMDAVERIIITASGGAFRDWPLDKLANASVDQASSHPNWDMGQRITIDSASMFNKALEVIETKEYFDVIPNMIEVIIHPESMVHALVGFRDGALMAHVGPPDMRHAIGYALHWPARQSLPVERLDLAQIATLSFRAPEDARYPALRLARDVMQAGGLTGAVFNAAKEVALDQFIAGRIGFLQMADVVEETLNRLDADPVITKPCESLDNVTQVDHLARGRATEIAAHMTS
ncbi:UNVERIFIED_CONTAM: hypothetical protein GTU68_055602 [Idotea baltica]|nr:hypothetical protein [Idotea baltica]